MKIINKRTSAVAVSALIALGGLTASANAVAGDHTIRQSDFVSGYSDTRSSGQYGFGPNGLVIETKDSTSNAKVAEYFARDGRIPSSGSYQWDGSANQPGDQIVFDVDGITGNSSTGQTANNDYNVLVGEQVYSQNQPGQALTDWWYTGGSTKAVTHGITCPDTSGGSGSDCHGTLKQWQDAVPDSNVTVAGFSLGSGVQGEGVLKSLSFGGDNYTFAAGEAAAPGPVSHNTQSDYTVGHPSHGLILHFTADKLGANEVQGDTVKWVVTVDGDRVFRIHQGSGLDDYYKYFGQRGTSHTVKIYKNTDIDGTPVQTFTVN